MDVERIFFGALCVVAGFSTLFYAERIAAFRSRMPPGFLQPPPRVAGAIERVFGGLLLKLGIVAIVGGLFA